MIGSGVERGACRYGALIPQIAPDRRATPRALRQRAPQNALAAFYGGENTLRRACESREIGRRTFHNQTRLDRQVRSSLRLTGRVRPIPLKNSALEPSSRADCSLQCLVDRSLGERSFPQRVSDALTRSTFP